MAAVLRTATRGVAVDAVRLICPLVGTNQIGMRAGSGSNRKRDVVTHRAHMQLHLRAPTSPRPPWSENLCRSVRSRFTLGVTAWEKRSPCVLGVAC